MKHLKDLGVLLAVAAVSAGVSCFYVKHYGNEKEIIIQETQQTPIQYSAYTHEGEPIDFTYAADRTVNAVVHVMTTYEMQQSRMNDPFLEYFFGERNYQQAPQKRQASGSGVILSKDGYIVTNNHVVEGASQVSVVLNDKRQFKAKIVGTDPTTDLALLKVEAEDLPSLPVGNSDDLKVGEWVLAVGNPFNLTSTVTAGIVSAKARNINILSGDMKIESFIQTDAAVNPGNSGGALVNTRGELVGINAAIASQTGSYSGYAFAIPTSIMSKVVADLKEFGTVQRALLGVQIRDIDAEFAKEKNLETMEGAYVAMVGEQSAAKEAGIKEGDIITHVSGHKVKTVSELQEKISRFRPGDKVQITLTRNNKQETFTVTLKNMKGDTSIVKNIDSKEIGATLSPISDKIKNSLGINYGLQVTDITKGGRFQQAGVPKGYIILRVNNQKVYSVDDVNEIIKSLKSEPEEQVIFLSGLLPNGKVVHYAVDMN